MAKRGSGSSRAAMNNRSNQLNPNNAAYQSSRQGSSSGTPSGGPITQPDKSNPPDKK